jgi:hypothetical protein
MKLDKNASFNAKTLIVGVLTCLIVGYIVGQAQVGEPWEEVDRLKREKRYWQNTYLQYKEACFDLKDQLENMTVTFYRLQVELAETNAKYEALNNSYMELKLLLEDDFVRFRLLTFSNLTITPTVIELGGNVTISFYITNLLPGPTNGYPFTIHIEGQDYGCDIMDCIDLEGYEAKRVSYIETPEAVGNYTVSISDFTGSFQVLEEG